MSSTTTLYLHCSSMSSTSPLYLHCLLLLLYIFTAPPCLHCSSMSSTTSLYLHCSSISSLLLYIFHCSSISSLLLYVLHCSSTAITAPPTPTTGDHSWLAHPVKHSTTLLSTAQHFTALHGIYCTALHCRVQCFALHDKEIYCTALICTALHCTVFH